MDYVTVTGLEIVRTGTHTDRTGKQFSVTAEDLGHAVQAASTLPNAVVKIGHVNGAIVNPEWGDGAPAYGQLGNLRISDDGQVLLADWVNAPADLAEKQPSAYPNRSMEATYGLTLRDEHGNIAEQYPMVITGMALLGETPPAVKTLEQVHAAFSATIEGRSVHASGGHPVQVLASLPGGRTRRELDDALHEAVRALSSDGTADAADGEVWYWLIDWDDEVAYYREERTQGRTFQRTYQIAADGTVTWTGPPVQVIPRHTFEPIEEAAQTVSASVPHPGPRLSESETTDAAKPVADHRGEGEAPMLSDATLAALRKHLGLPEDATDETIAQAIQDSTQDPANATGTATAGGDTDNGDQEPAAPEPGAGETAEPQPIAASAPGAMDTVQVSRAQLDQMIEKQAQMEVQLSSINQERQDTFIDSKIGAAKQAGKIHPNDEQNVRAMFAAAPEAAATYLDALHPVIPTQERGSVNAQFSAGVDKALQDERRKAYHEAFGVPAPATDKNEEAR